MGGVCQQQKGVFLLVFLLFGGFVFLCVFIFLLEKNKKVVFLQFWSLFYVPKRPVFKSFFSSYSVIFSGVPFVFPFTTPLFFFAFCPSSPCWKTLIVLVSLSFFFLPFPFSMFACFFQTNFPNIPFLKPKLLSFLVVYLFLLFCFCFHVLCFCLSVLMLALFLVCFILILSCFCFVSCCFHRP